MKISGDYKKGKSKRELDRDEQIRRETQQIPLVPEDWMRMYGDLASLIGFPGPVSQTFAASGGALSPTFQDPAPVDYSRLYMDTPELGELGLSVGGLEAGMDDWIGEQDFPRPETEEDYAALPDGAYFIDDDQVLKRKPSQQTQYAAQTGPFGGLNYG